MKVILNVNTNFEGVSLSQGTEIDVELKVAERWITRGLAHLPVEVKSKEPQITYEDLDGIASFSEKVVTEIDVIEPISTDKYVSFDEPKISKQIKKAKKR